MAEDKSREIEFCDLVSPSDPEGSKRVFSRTVPGHVPRNLRSSLKNSDQSIFDSLTLYKRAKRGINGRYTTSKQHNKLDTNMFESYVEELWRSTSDSERNSFAYLDSLWFSLYKEGLTEEKEDQKAKVLKWIKEKNIFLRKYVFVPIVCWSHWNLLILCHIGEKIESKTKKPCMLLLDSLEKTDPKRLEPDIRRFVWDICKMNPKTKQVTKDSILGIPLLVPKVPQQRNGDECGIFVLYFIYLFMKKAPEVFNLKEYPYFLTEKWFDLEELEIFRKDRLILNIQEKEYIEID